MNFSAKLFYFILLLFGLNTSKRSYNLEFLFKMEMQHIGLMIDKKKELKQENLRATLTFKIVYNIKGLSRKNLDLLKRPLHKRFYF